MVGIMETKFKAPSGYKKMGDVYLKAGKKQINTICPFCEEKVVHTYLSPKDILSKPRYLHDKGCPRLAELANEALNNETHPCPKGWSREGIFWAAPYTYGLRYLCPVCGELSTGRTDTMHDSGCPHVWAEGKNRTPRVEIEPAKGKGTFELRKYHESISADFLNYGLRSLNSFLESYCVDLHPDYQRDHVWTDRQASQFVGHCLQGGDPGIVYINPKIASGEKLRHRNDFTKEFEVVDGKQRITACLRFANNEIPAELYDGTKVWISEFDNTSWAMLSLSITLKIGILGLKTRRDVLRFYLRLNRGGTVHSDDEIEKVKALLAEEEAEAC